MDYVTNLMVIFSASSSMLNPFQLLASHFPQASTAAANVLTSSPSSALNAALPIPSMANGLMQG
jgi:hypothetical protein